MSIKFHDITIAGTPELSTLVQAGDNRAVTSAAVNSAVTPKANQTDLADIHQTSPTCTEANGIGSGAYFYLDNVLVQALTSISNGATFTSGTNYTTVTAGALNDLKSAFDYKVMASNTDLSTLTETGIYSCASSTVAATLVDSPITDAGFVMLTFKWNTGSGQLIIANGGRLRYRRLTSEPWRALDGGVV